MLSSVGSNSVCSAASRSFGSGVAKRVVEGQAARLKILRGCEKLADCVGATLGPNGRNVIIEQSFGGPKMTKDGVTVAKAIDLEDPLENLGASLIKQVAQNANEASGDGTTTATLLAREIFKGGCEACAAGMKPIEVLKGMKLATEKVQQYLNENCRKIETDADLYNVARVSANGDKEIGNLISEAMQQVGRDGVITIADGKSVNHQLTVVEGYEFDRGYLSPYFASDSKTLKCTMENPYVLLVDGKVSSAESLISILEKVLQENRGLLIVAEELDQEVLALLLVNKVRANLKVCAVRSPGFGEYRSQQLDDLAVLTGAVVVGKDRSVNYSIDCLGLVKKAVVGKDTTLLMEGSSDSKKLEQRLESLKHQMNDPDASEYTKTKLQERFGKLSGGVAVISVGGSSELEVGEAKDRLEDALNATRAAIDSGILPGGGTALLLAAKSLESLKGENLDQSTGIKIIKKACQLPIKKICDNAGYEGSIIAVQVADENKFGRGFDASKGHFCDMFQEGIIDPTKVVYTAITDASSIASLMCTTEAAIFTPKSEKDAKLPESPMSDY